MHIRIIRYTASFSPRVQGFADVEIDHWLRFNGLNYNRDGTLESAQLTPVRNGKRLFFPAVEILDSDLRQLLAEELVAAIRAHVETLPPEQRMKPVRVPDRQQPAPAKPVVQAQGPKPPLTPPPRPVPARAPPKPRIVPVLRGRA